MFENITKFFKKFGKQEKEKTSSKDAAKERLHLVLMQDRANVSADFLDLMKQEIIEVIKKYIDVDEREIDVRLTNKTNEDGTTGAPALYANIPIISIKEEAKKEAKVEKEKIDEITKSAKEIIENVKKEDGEKVQEKPEDNPVVENDIEAGELVNQNEENNVIDDELNNQNKENIEEKDEGKEEEQAG